jgi:hypothetical protein
LAWSFFLWELSGSADPAALRANLMRLDKQPREM